MSEDAKPAPASLPRLTREELKRRLAAARSYLRTEELEVPALGGVVTIREVPGRLRTEFEDALEGTGKFEGVPLVERMAFLFSIAVVDEDGAPLFTVEDAAALGELPPTALFPLYQAVARVNALGVQAKAARLGESEAGPSGGSSSDSPASSDSHTRAGS